MAIGATAVWEVRTTGSDANGGFYTSGGTDYSQQDAAQLTVTDCVTNGTTTVTSATGGFTAAMIGNGINIAGTIRQITARTDTNTITVDATVGAASGQTAKVGGALASLTKAIPNTVGANIVYVKSGTYDHSAAPGIAPVNNIAVIGYSTTRGDNPTGSGRPLFRATANSISILDVSARVNNRYEYLRIDGNGFTGVTGFTFGNSRSSVTFVSVSNCATGFSLSSCFAINCDATSCTTGFSTGTTFGCVTTTCTTGFNACNARSCISSGGTTGYAPTTNNSTMGCIAYSATTGFNVSATTLITINCLASTCGTGFNNNVAAGMMFNCAGYNNTTNVATLGTLAVSSSFAALTVDPFVNAASGNFALNSTAGGGAACKAAGIPGAFPGGTTTGYLDIGAAQSQAGGGASTARIFNGF